MENFKIVADSSSDIFCLDGLPFSSAPLKILAGEKEFIDDERLAVGEMVGFLSKYKGRSTTSCPNVQDWLDAFGEAEHVFCVTITATLSGSYNSALLAKKTYEERYPDRRVTVINSLSTGPEMKLIIEKLRELILSGCDFDDISLQIQEYAQNTGLIFMLQSMKNLANNGRVSPIVAKAAGILGIRIIGKASDKGDLETLDKCRGEQKALECIVSDMKKLGWRGGSVRIAHCFNEGAAEKLQQLIKAQFENTQTEIYCCGGLCSFYAERGGLLVGFEKE